MVVAAAVITAGAASAATCPSGKACMWWDSGRGGAIYTITNYTTYVGNTWNDEASSFENKTNGNRAWWWDINCSGGTTQVLGPGQYGEPSWWANDETSSVGRTGCA